MQEFIKLANRLADEAGKIVYQYYRKPFEVISKEDESPVTIADRTIEKRMRDIIEAERPEDGIYGEEFGIKESQNGYTWVLDPIDGTKPFIIGRPTFGTLIALCKDDVPILGVIDQAILKDRWIGVQGQPTTHNGRPVKTRPCLHLKDATCAITAPGMFDGYRGSFIKDLRGGFRFIAWGGDCISYGLLASGHLDAVIEANMQPYDYLACVPIIEGAGGFISDFEGQPLTLNSKDTVLALGDKALLNDVERILR